MAETQNKWSLGDHIKCKCPYCGHFDEVDISLTNEVVMGAITIKMMQGLLFSHFAKRGRGRPKRNTEVPRLIRGFKAMVKASGIHLNPQEETVILEQLLNQSLF